MYVLESLKPSNVDMEWKGDASLKYHIVCVPMRWEDTKRTLAAAFLQVCVWNSPHAKTIASTACIGSKAFVTFDT